MISDGLLETLDKKLVTADGKTVDLGDTLYAYGGMKVSVDEIVINRNGCFVMDSGRRAGGRFPVEQLFSRRRDSWDVLRDDATLSPYVYCQRYVADIDPDMAAAECTEAMALSIIDRCKLLAEGADE